MHREQIITAVWLPLTAHQERELVAASERPNGTVTARLLATRARLVGLQLATWVDPTNPSECRLTTTGYMYANKLRDTWARYGSPE